MCCILPGFHLSRVGASLPVSSLACPSIDFQVKYYLGANMLWSKLMFWSIRNMNEWLAWRVATEAVRYFQWRHMRDTRGTVSVVYRSITSRQTPVYIQTTVSICRTITIRSAVYFPTMLWSCANGTIDRGRDSITFSLIRLHALAHAPWMCISGCWGHLPRQQGSYLDRSF